MFCPDSPDVLFYAFALRTNDRWGGKMAGGSVRVEDSGASAIKWQQRWRADCAEQLKQGAWAGERWNGKQSATGNNRTQPALCVSWGNSKRQTFHGRTQGRKRWKTAAVVEALAGTASRAVLALQPMVG